MHVRNDIIKLNVTFQYKISDSYSKTIEPFNICIKLYNCENHETLPEKSMIEIFNLKTDLKSCDHWIYFLYRYRGFRFDSDLNI